VSIMPQSLEITTLGGLEVVRNCERVDLPASRKTRALLAYLAVTARAHRRERLCELFWEIPEDPRGSLRWSLTKIRRLVDDASIQRVVARRDSVQFELRGAAVDVHQLREALRDSLETLPPARLREIAARFLGEFLDGIDLPNCPAFQSWLVAERDEVRMMRRRVLSALTNACGDDSEAALSHARALVEVDPRDEAAQLLLIRMLVRTGRVREAREQHQIACRLLVGADVSAGGRLALALREIDAHLAPGASESVTTPPAAASPVAPQEIRFCTAKDGVRIAYATVGTGPPLAKAANWLSHLEYDWQSPIWQPLMELLCESHTLVRYDERCNGLSDLDAADVSFETFVSDLEGVVDASGIDRFPLVGISQGCSVAIAYAVRHPERVTSLILHGYAHGWNKRGDLEERIAREAMLTLVRIGWGRPNPAFRQIFTMLFFPDGTPEQIDWFNELQRVCTTAANAVRLLRATGNIDVSELLAQVRVPTLVTHCKGDQVVPFDEGRNLATAIPGARFVQLESRNHLVLEQEPAWTRFSSEVRAFLDDHQ
jgi:pimeloyl-ACP methyl ester carboxylesterase/DNA-binding SARP family transcriptional activator